MFRQVSVMDVDTGDREQEPNFDHPSPKPTSSSNHHHHQPLYATLAEYTLNSPRSFPIDPSSSTSIPNASSSSRRPSSPLRSIEEYHMNEQLGPSKGYTFPSSSSKTLSPAKENINIGMTAMAPSMSPTSSSIGGLPLASTSMTSTAQHRLSVSGRPRRPSPLLHEIQPPSRRLSAHQMLLLTPFGGPLPAGALNGTGGLGMSRGSSSMGHALPTAPARLGSGTSQSSGWPRRDSATSSSHNTPIQLAKELPTAGPRAPLNPAPSMGRESPLPTANRFPPRSRHSLAHPVVNPSPLASAPMTTIFSEGSSEGASSRDPSTHEMERNQTFMSRDEVGVDARERERDEDHEADSPPKTRARLLSATVAMTRSNSLPVLTLRELQALKEKDGELGIQRGGDWAWVSRDGDDPDDAEMETPSLGTETSTNASTSTTSLVTPSEQPTSSSSYRNPFTSFHDPFAPRQPGVTPVSIYAPMATSSDYHYSPTGPGAELRRMSDAPPTTSTATPSPTSRGGRRSVTDSRRPSAPTALRQSISAMTPRPVQRRTPPQASQATFQQHPTHQPFTAPEETSPHGSPITSLPPASRPRLLRYKSSPARTTGLGLNIVVRPTNAGGGNPGSDRSPGDTGSTGTDSRGSMGEQSNSAGPSRGSFTTGHWAEVDFVDTLAAAADIALASTTSETVSSGPASATGMSRNSSSFSPTAIVQRNLSTSSNYMTGRGTSSSHNVSSTFQSESNSSPQTSIGSKYKIEQVTSRSHIQEFDNTSEPVFKGRSRFESVDSAFPLMPGGQGGRLSVPTQGAGEMYAHSTRNSSFSVVENGILPGLSEGFPRRGSLGMGTFARLRKMVSGSGSGKQQQNNNNNNDLADELGQRLVAASGSNGALAISSPHWSERRGSWAEGWSNGN